MSNEQTPYRRCQDCRFSEPDKRVGSNEWNNWDRAKCLHEKCRLTDTPLTDRYHLGLDPEERFTSPACSVARGRIGKCGPGATLFEPRSSEEGAA